MMMMMMMMLSSSTKANAHVTWEVYFRKLLVKVAFETNCHVNGKVICRKFACIFAGSAAFDFTCLLHTYFRVPDVTKAAVSNLRGCSFTDKVGFFKLG